MGFCRVHQVVCCSVAFCFAALIAANAQIIHVSNPSFEEDVRGTPAGWALSAGEGWVTKETAREGDVSLLITGSGNDTNYWRTPALDLDPSATYALHFSMRRLARTEGTPITGPVFCNRDYGELRQEWVNITSHFMTPHNLTPAQSWIRFGQWHVDGSIAFDDVALARVQPVYARLGDVVLGDGERIHGNIYEFVAPWVRSRSNCSRPMVAHDCHFNTIRLVFGAGSEAVFKHDIPGRRQASASVSIGVFYYFTGALHIEASQDGATWLPIGVLKEKAFVTFPLPKQVFPADAVWVRLRAEAGRPLGVDSDIGAFAVNEYEYTAEIDGAPFDIVGRTQFVEVRSVDSDLGVEIVSLGEQKPGHGNAVRLSVANPGSEPLVASAAVQLETPAGAKARFARKVRLEPGKQRVMLAYELQTPGAYVMSVDLGGFHAETEFYVADLYNVAYGERLPGSTPKVALWWASSGWKVSKERPAPSRKGNAVLIRAARNEAEAAQVVIRPGAELKGLCAECSDLVGKDGALIPSSAVDVLRVRYVPVVFPTDYKGAIDEWPDPLPPFREPVDVAANENQALWVRVTVPMDAPAGIYKGAVRLRAEGFEADVPLHVEIYDFTLPDRMACTTALGMGTGNIFRYHGVTEETDKRLVAEKYLENFSAHHISPYDPAPLDPFTITWPDVKPGDDVDLASLRPDIDWTAWDAAMEKAVDHYHFNTFRLGLAGMGGGHWPSRRPPRLLGFGEDTPEYEALFASYCRQLEEHLRQKGWLDEAFLYWYDEPNPKDYDFVREGNERIKAVAPGLRRMLTEQVEPELTGGPNLWCPGICSYDHAKAEKRRAHGEHFWWYVCTGPKAPYPGLFIDHAGTEMRVWLWQTWQRGIEGILVWDTTLWTTQTAYPGHSQNPYEDAMSWTSGQRRAPWGNGDGRFVYPPEAAANANHDRPILDGPVDSIRWEMLRDGIEDYEYFVILKNLLDQRGENLSPRRRRKLEALLQVPENVTSTMTQFTNHPAPIEAHRHKLAKAIEDLERKAP
ncbi:MAG TPA: DUF4091 domain-containing protein [Candidatus Hydrogenedentes bacterium]|nr:DUF4091 domain-containing protein [Candidatus Hydrogenedentota bacterium]